jgi:hypothetical protein
VLMSHRSLNRDRHLFKIQHNTKTPEEFLTALSISPYKTHRRMSVALSQSILDVMPNKEIHADTTDIPASRD